jgi:hypothetical protein
MAECSDPLELICYWSVGDYSMFAIYISAELSLSILIQILWSYTCKRRQA